MPDFFQNQVVLVTGASSGIGHALALELARRGAKVGLVARRKEALEKLSRTIRDQGGSTSVSAADVSVRSELQTAVRSIREQLGPIDILIANAGIGTPTLLDPVNIHDVEQMFRVNVFGVIYAIEAVLPEMLKRGKGHLAAVSSIAAFKGLPGESSYCATKAAVNTYMEGLRIQLRERRIPVTVACPGFVSTPMTAINDFHMPFLMSADAAAREILFAIRRRKKIHRFPRRMSWLMRLTGWLPDWVVAKSMKSYTEKPPMNEIR
jgi:short-subunit dehydrogenase